MRKLHNYQLRGIDFCKGNPNVILSVGMGLGKTATVLHYINQATRLTSCLIVAPKRVAENNWKQECLDWELNDLHDRFVVVKGTKTQRAKLIQSSKWLIIGRDNLADVENMFFDLVVLDELTSFKNNNSNRSLSCYSIGSHQKIGLTGTLMTNGAIDLFGQFCAVGIGGKMTKKERNNIYYRWRGTHFKDQLAGSGLQFQKWKAVSPLEVILSNVKDCIFTLDSKDYLEIPDVTYHEHYIKLTDNEQSEYMSLKTKLFCELDGEVVAFDENQKFAKLQTICDGFVYDDDGDSIRSEYSTKIDAVVEFVDRCVNENEQVLLFYSFREEKAWIEEKLKKQHIKFTDVKDKNFIHKWNDGDIDVLLAHPASAGHGLNLQHGGRILVWSTITYDFELFAQANARLARQGQKRAVQIHCFMAKDTIEKDKLKALRDKEKELNNFLELTKQ